jgi:hypothetical protein
MNRKAHLLHVDLREGMERMFGKRPKKRRQILRGIDFNHSELPNAGVVATEILKTPDESERSGHRRGKRHRSQIIFAVRATKPLL